MATTKTLPDDTPAGMWEQLKDDLGYLKLTRAAEVLPGLLDTARDQGWSHTRLLATLISEEAAATRDRRLAARLRFAHLPATKSLDDFDYDFQPTIDRTLIDDLRALRWIDKGNPILLLGQPGLG